MLSLRTAVADPARLAAIESHRLSGHAGDADLDAVVTYMARALEAPIAVINLVGPDLQYFPAEIGVGLPYSHVPDELSFCAYVVAERAPLEVPDAQQHPVFAGTPPWPPARSAPTSASSTTSPAPSPARSSTSS